MLSEEKRARYFKELQGVTTVPEVANLWGVNQTTVIYHIMRDNIIAVKIGIIWVVSLRSVIDFWGMPCNLPVCEPVTPIDVLRERYKAS